MSACVFSCNPADSAALISQMVRGVQRWFQDPGTNSPSNFQSYKKTICDIAVQSKIRKYLGVLQYYSNIPFWLNDDGASPKMYQALPGTPDGQSMPGDGVFPKLEPIIPDRLAHTDGALAHRCAAPLSTPLLYSLVPASIFYWVFYL